MTPIKSSYGAKFCHQVSVLTQEPEKDLEPWLPIIKGGCRDMMHELHDCATVSQVFSKIQEEFVPSEKLKRTWKKKWLSYSRSLADQVSPLNDPKLLAAWLQCS